MNKYDYVTVTIDEEKIRLEKVIAYLEKEKNNDELILYKERYNNILRYLNARDKYLEIEDSIKDDILKLDKYYIMKEEYAVDNILLEDTLLSKFHVDTNNKYRNILYEDIKEEAFSIRDILYLLFDKETDYIKLVNKRKKLSRLITKDIYPRTYDTLISQDVIIEKQDNILDEIFILENNIKMEEKKIYDIKNSIMTDSILKILYEFCIIDSYDKDKVNKNDLFSSKRNFIAIKDKVDTISNIEEATYDSKESTSEDSRVIKDLNLPGIDENIKVDIDGKKYVNNDK